MQKKEITVRNTDAKRAGDIRKKPLRQVITAAADGANANAAKSAAAYFMQL